MIVVVPTQRQDSLPGVVVPTQWAGFSARCCCCADTWGQDSLPEIVVVPTHGGRIRCQRLLLCRHVGRIAARDTAQDSSAGFTVYETVVVPT